MKCTEILGSRFLVNKMFLAARSRWTILCLWRWYIPAAIPRTNSNISSSDNFSFELNKSLSKLPAIPKYSTQSNPFFSFLISFFCTFLSLSLTSSQTHSISHQLKRLVCMCVCVCDCMKCVRYVLPPAQYSRTRTTWGPSNETPNIWTTFGWGGNSLYHQSSSSTHFIITHKYQFNSTN
jgi:hypothetical protein